MIEGLGARRGVPEPGLRVRALPLAAAAVVLASLLGALLWHDGPRDGSAALEAILARGDVAVRRAADASWRAVPADEVALELRGRFLELATPPERGIEVRAQGGWSARAAGATRLRWTGSSAAPTSRVAELRAGGVRVRVEGDAAPSEVRTAHGSFRLADGVLDVALAELDTLAPELALQLAESVSDGAVAPHLARVELHSGSGLWVAAPTGAPPPSQGARLTPGEVLWVHAGPAPAGAA